METGLKIKAAAGVAGGLIGSFFGGWDALLYALIIAVGLDYLTGFLLAASEKKLSSAVGFNGIAKKMTIFVMVALAHLVDTAVIGSGSVFRNAVVLFYFANEGLSILENSARLGLPVPKKLKGILVQVRAKDDEEQNEKEKTDDADNQ